MRMEYRQSLRMEQKLLQSPQMIQAMQVLQLTAPELLDRVESELEDNPFLELADPQEGERTSEDGENQESQEQDEPDLEGLERLFDERPAGDGQRSSNTDESWDLLQNIPAPEGHTKDGILAELRVAETPQEELLDAELLLAGLDEKGFLPEGIETLAETHGLPLQGFLDAQAHLREVAHPALGAKNIQEAYLLQLRAMPDPHPVAEELVVSHFDDLLSNRLPQIATAMGVTLVEVRSALEILSILDSRPLHEYAPDNSMAIQPDVLISQNERGEYEVSLTRDGLPDLRLSKNAQLALEKARNDKRLHSFLLKKIERARWFLDAVGQRRETLLKISKVLVQRQREFLDYGMEKLKPLKMQEVADLVSVHISTVSRATRGKWAQTPQGILPLKDFFSGGQANTDGGSTSRIAIQKRIQQIVSAEDKTAPLSDEEIIKILKNRDGIKVARRTVTKYRKSLDIPSSTMRRNFG
ncbi:MAG TPA: RNA polymerase factor sigma-54 [Planctomycetota bacterium]|nr:RNA polymerase sigma-54 factor [Planctomycetota bacterium]HJM40438.1 RNA polymerase factor sigma-54 [Planctomycetota bacterium]